MSNVINFPALRKDTPLDLHIVTNRSKPHSVNVVEYSQDIEIENKCPEINDIEEELSKFVDKQTLTSHCSYNYSENERDRAENEDQEECLPSLKEIEEIIVFSPEIQKNEIEDSPDNKPAEPVLWGDVFIKTGDEYPFLFTVYTKMYARDQLLYYGEMIEPSSKDIILNRDQLFSEDIIRAIIKWTNQHSQFLMGKPISLEEHSILKTLVCEPLVEVKCPESFF